MAHIFHTFHTYIYLYKLTILPTKCLRHFPQLWRTRAYNDLCKCVRDKLHGCEWGKDLLGTSSVQKLRSTNWCSLWKIILLTTSYTVRKSLSESMFVFPFKKALFLNKKKRSESFEQKKLKIFFILEYFTFSLTQKTTSLNKKDIRKPWV